MTVRFDAHGFRRISLPGNRLKAIVRDILQVRLTGLMSGFVEMVKLGLPLMVRHIQLRGQ